MDYLREGKGGVKISSSQKCNPFYSYYDNHYTGKRYFTTFYFMIFLSGTLKLLEFLPQTREDFSPIRKDLCHN